MFSSVMNDSRSEDGTYCMGWSLLCFQVSGRSPFHHRVMCACPSHRCSSRSTRQHAYTDLSVGQSDIDGVGAPAFRPSVMDCISVYFTGGKRCSSGPSALVMFPPTVH